MKILILSAATGGGHLRASRALQTYIRENTEGNEVVIADALKSINTILDKTCCDGYHFMATKAPRVFGRLYRATNMDTPLYSLVSRFNGAVGVRLMPLLTEEKPDVIISTHPFATEMVSHLKGKGRVTAPLICLMTDYGPHRAWIAPHVDAYVVANEAMASQMTEWGVPEEKIHPFGIPVEDVFFSKADKHALLREFGLSSSLPTVLFMAGSFGVMNILGIYKDLVRTDFPFQIIIITGRNKRLYRAFQKIILRSPKPTKLVFFTDRVADYMHACDLLVTKPRRPDDLRSPRVRYPARRVRRDPRAGGGQREFPHLAQHGHPSRLPQKLREGDYLAFGGFPASRSHAGILRVV